MMKTTHIHEAFAARLLLLLTALLTACQGVDECTPYRPAAAERAFDEIWELYEDEYGFVDPSCRQARPVTQSVPTGDDFPDVCLPSISDTALGCTVPADDGTAEVWVLDCDWDTHATLMHEGLHAIFLCENDQVDNGHAAEAWTVLDVL